MKTKLQEVVRDIRLLNFEYGGKMPQDWLDKQAAGLIQEYARDMLLNNLNAIKETLNMGHPKKDKEVFYNSLLDAFNGMIDNHIKYEYEG